MLEDINDVKIGSRGGRKSNLFCFYCVMHMHSEVYTMAVCLSVTSWCSVEMVIEYNWFLPYPTLYFRGNRLFPKIAVLFFCNLIFLFFGHSMLIIMIVVSLVLSSHGAPMFVYNILVMVKSIALFATAEVCVYSSSSVYCAH